MFVDTHCHIHDAEYPLDGTEVLAAATEVDAVVCVGTDYGFSKQAIEFAGNHEKAWASVGLHPHDTSNKAEDAVKLAELANQPRVVAVGECGLDYYYLNSDKAAQKSALITQFELAKEYRLPMIFHIRDSQDAPGDAFADFWPMYDHYKPLGVVHSFTAGPTQLEKILTRNLYVGVNGIATFSKPGPLLEALDGLPLANMVLETDAPFLTPTPFRGRINEPKYVGEVVQFLSRFKSVDVAEVARITSANARQLFNLT